MKTERITHNPPPITPIRGKILGRLELFFVRDRKAAGGHRRLVARFAMPGDRRDVEIFAPAVDAAWRSASRVAKRERNRQRREELGNERAEKIQKRLEAEDRRKRAAEYRPDLNLTIKREWLDEIVFRGKAEEYRAPSCKQVARLWNELASIPKELRMKRTVVAVLRAGYTMDAYAAAVVVEGVRVGTISHHPEWGEPNGPHYAIAIGSVVGYGRYSDVKDKLGRALFLEGSDHA